jgi:hypothetical protein
MTPYLLSGIARCLSPSTQQKKMLAELEAAPGRWIDASTGREIEDEPKP